jgi:hypothetical protein
MVTSSKLTIKLLSQDPEDTAGIAGDLKANLGESANVEVTEEKTGEMTGRSIDPGTVVMAVGIVVTGVEIGVKALELLVKIREKRPGQSYIIETTDGGSFKITEIDTLEDAIRKLKKAERKPGLIGRLTRKGKKD